MMKNKTPNINQTLMYIANSNIPEQIKGNISKSFEGLLDLISRYKEKRNIWEIKLKGNDDPRRAEFYAIMARLSMLDLIVDDLRYLNNLLGDN